MHTDKQTVFDLIATVNDHRRYLDAAALGPGGAERRAQYRRQSRSEAMMVAKVRRRLAQHGDGLPSSQELQGYVDSLIAAYSDDGVGLPAYRDGTTRVQKRSGSG